MLKKVWKLNKASFTYPFYCIFITWKICQRIGFWLQIGASSQRMHIFFGNSLSSEYLNRSFVLVYQIFFPSLLKQNLDNSVKFIYFHARHIYSKAYHIINRILPSLTTILTRRPSTCPILLSRDS